MPKQDTDSPQELIFKGIGLLILGLIAAYGVRVFMNYMESRLEGFEARAATVTYYFMDGCPHCRAMKPEWQKFKELTKKSGDTVVAKEVSADLDQEEVSKAKPKVSGFPTIHILYKGHVEEYNGKRDAASLMAAAKKAMDA